MPCGGECARAVGGASEASGKRDQGCAHRAVHHVDRDGDATQSLSESEHPGGEVDHELHMCGFVIIRGVFESESAGDRVRPPLVRHADGFAREERLHVQDHLAV